MDNKTDDFVTVKTFSYPHEVGIIRARLESEGIECFVKDELTAQVQPFYSNAIGGVKLQVKESDIAKAIEILKEAGYLQQTDERQSIFFSKLDSITSKIPFLGKQLFVLRLLIIVAIIISLLVTSIYFATLPTTYERLTKENWCLHYVTYKGKDYTPNTTSQLQLYMIGGDYCNERIDFRTNGYIVVPGFNTHQISGNWSLSGNILHLDRPDTLQHVFKGDYNIDFTKNKLTLKSSTTTIHCYKTN